MNTTPLGRRWLPVGAAALVVLALLGYFLVRGFGADAGANPSPTDPASSGASPTPSLPVRSTPVPPPTPGTIDQTVAPVNDGPTQTADLEEPAALRDGVEVSLVGITSTSIEAVGPGDTSGPAIAVTVRVRNGSKESISVDNAVITMLYGKKGTVATPSPADPAKPLEGTVERDGSAEGTYVFRVPAKTQDKVTVLVTYTAGAPVAQFDGAVR
jgi:hypothetical protein